MDMLEMIGAGVLLTALWFGLPLLLIICGFLLFVRRNSFFGILMVGTGGIWMYFAVGTLCQLQFMNKCQAMPTW